MPDPAFEEAFQRNAMIAAVRIGGLALLLAWCLDIVRPFVTIGVWAIVMAVALGPLYDQLKARLGGSNRVTVSAIVVAGLLLVLVPTLFLLDSVARDADGLGTQLGAGTITLPSLPEGIASAPLIGRRVSELWAAAAADPATTLGPHIRNAAHKLLGAAANLLFTILQFTLAFVAALPLMINAERGKALAQAVGRSLLGPHGDAFADLATQTVRSVARGVLGVALLEGLITGVSLRLLGIPGAGLIGLAALAMAIVQLPAPLLLLGVMGIVFAQGSTGTGIAVLIVTIVVGVVDNVLKPILLGQGVQVPTLVILVGAIGGTLSMGLLGLFVGPIVLVVGYTLLSAWIAREGAPAPAA